ncbi:MAG: hypothetical protein Kow00109_07650 [Acidobacteriota bacterium]
MIGPRWAVPGGAGRLLEAALLLCLTLLPARGAQPDLPTLDDRLLESLEPGVRRRIEVQLADLRTGPRQSVLLAEVGMLLHANGHPEAAVPWYRAAAEAAPREFAWRYYEALAAEAAGDAAAAEAAYQRARELRPDYPPLLLRLADLLARRGAWEAALELYETVSARFPEFAPAHYGRGKALEALGHTEEARKAFATACRLYPSYGAAHYALARLLRSTAPGEAQQHLAAYQQYRLVRPGFADPYEEEVARRKAGVHAALEHLREAITLGEAGRIEESIRLHEKVIAEAPELIEPYVNLLILYGKSGRFDEAAATYRRALGVSADSDDLHYNFGVVLLQQERFAEAEAAFREALQINPLRADAWVNLGQIAERRGDTAAAEDAYRKARNADPKFRLARYHLARLAAARGELDTARRELEAILEPEDAETARYYYALAAVQVRLGRLEAARDLTLRARDLAERYGQKELLDAIGRDLAKLEAALASR